MMKCWMLALIALGINLLQRALMARLEYIMYSLVPAYHFCKDIKMKSLRYHLTHKVIRLSLLVVIKHAEFGL